MPMYNKMAKLNYKKENDGKKRSSTRRTINTVGSMKEKQKNGSKGVSDIVCCYGWNIE